MSMVEVFLSYAPEDEEYRWRLEKQLQAFQREGLIRVWHNRNISPGEEREQKIHAHLNTAQIVLLLVSPDFMNSDYCYGVEMQRAIQRHNTGEACVIPVILRPTHWQGAPFGKLQVLPTNARPIQSYAWHSLDEAFFDVAEGIRRIIEAFIAKSSNDEFSINAPSYPIPSLGSSKKSISPESYRKALHADHHIALIQILNMSRPLKVIDVYIRVQLRWETRLSYELDSALHNASAGYDPNALLKASQLQMKNRSSAPIAPERAIYKNKRCVILGDPGTGKTTLLKYLAVKSADQQLPKLDVLPIYIELNAFASSGYPTLLKFAASVWEGRYGFPQIEALAYMQARLEEGKVLLLLDALDETVTGKTQEESEASYQRVIQAIESLANYTPYRNAPIVVTVRKAGYYQRAIRLRGFTELEVLDFQPEEIKQFVNRWFSDRPNLQKRASATDLNARLERNLRIQTLAANPLLLSLIIIVYEDQLTLPDLRVELYKQCVVTLLNKWDDSRNTHRLHELKTEHKEQLLKEVAWHFHLQGQRYFPESELLSVLADFLPAIGFLSEQGKRILDEIVAVTGLLKEQAHGWYGFLHLTLQEYLAAQYAVDHNKLNTLLEHCLDPWWEEVILLYAGSAPDVSLLLQKLLDQRDDIFGTYSILGGRCLATRPMVKEVILRGKVLSRLFSMLPLMSFSLIQEQVAHALAEIGGTEVNRRLVDILSDSQFSSDLQTRIAGALGHSNDRSLIPDLLQLLYDKRIDPNVRVTIARALAALGGRSIVSDLLHMLPDEPLGGQLPRILSKLGDCSVAPSLLSLLSNEQMDYFTRSMTAQALGTLGERSIVPNLLSMLYDQKIDPSLREDIAQALGPLGERSIVPDLLSMLHDQKIHPQVRGGIAQALGTLGNHSVISDLLRLLSNQYTDSSVLEGIIDALGRLNDPSVIPDLLQLLPNEEMKSQIREKIVDTLDTLGGHSVTADLVQVLRNEKVHLNVRQRIARVLRTIGDHSVLPPLLSLLSSSQTEPSLGECIAKALGKCGDRSVIPFLVPLLSDAQIAPSVRESIIGALGDLGDRSVVPLLRQKFDEVLADPPLHWSLVKAAKELGKQALTPEFLRYFRYQSFNYLMYLPLAIALGKLGDSSVIPFLLYLLSDPQISDNLHWYAITNTHKDIIDLFRTFSGPSDISRLIQIFSKKEKKDYSCELVIKILEQLIHDETNIYELATLLPRSKMANHIYQVLWSASHRANIRVFLVDDSLGKEIKVVKVNG